VTPLPSAAACGRAARRPRRRAATGAAGLAVALAAALSVGGCMGLGDSLSGPAPAPPPVATDAAVGAGVNIPPGSGEDFIVNVGRRVFFKGGSAEIDATAQVTLDKQALWLNRFPNWNVKVQGFADDPGAPEANMALSLRRAEAVRDYLIRQGVAPVRMRVKAYGRDRLVRDCPDIDCQSQNRRVIINLEGDEDR